MTYTTQKQIRAAFWESHQDLPRRKITNYAGNGKMYQTDTRCAFCDFVDALNKNGEISDQLANRATL